MTNNTNTAKQKGYVLITAIVFLAMLSMLGITALDATNLEEKMTRNARSQIAAKQASESALRDAERRASTFLYVEEFRSPVTPGLFLDDDASKAQNTPNELISTGWTAASADVSASPASNTNVGIPPLYRMTYVGKSNEEVAENKSLEGYDSAGIGVESISYIKTSARGVAADGVTETILQIYYATRLQ